MLLINLFISKKSLYSKYGKIIVVLNLLVWLDENNRVFNICEIVT